MNYRIALVGGLMTLLPVAQSPSRPGPITVTGPQTPIRIEVAKPAVAGEPFRFVMANASPKAIAGVVVAITFYDAQGKAEEGPAQVTAISLLPDEPGLAPSAGKPVQVNGTYVIGRGSRQAAPARAELSVDYVLYMDNTTWGPNRTHNASELNSVRSGAAMERSRLADILKKQGPAALLARLGLH